MKKYNKHLVLLVLIAAAIWGGLHRELFNHAVIEQWIREAGLFGWAVHIFLYALGTVLFFPGSVLTLAGGAIFGPILGTVLNLTGAIIGSGVAFLIARYVASDWVQRKAGGQVKRLMDGVDAEGWRFVAFVRLVPLFPFNILNYALGLTRIPFGHYLLASLICMAPGGAAYTYLGYVGREAATGGEGVVKKVVIGIALLAVAFFIPYWVKKWRANKGGVPIT